MLYQYDYIERETAKAVMFIHNESFCWVPKSCIINKRDNEFETIDTFFAEWKGEGSSNTYIKSTPQSRQIILTEDIKRDIWEYI